MSCHQYSAIGAVGTGGVREPDLERIKREAPLIVARAAESEKLDWQAILQQGRQWLSSQAA
jgi:hypothetical protein